MQVSKKPQNESAESNITIESTFIQNSKDSKDSKDSTQNKNTESKETSHIKSSKDLAELNQNEFLDSIRNFGGLWGERGAK